MNRRYILDPRLVITLVSEETDEKPQYLVSGTADGEKYELGEEELFLLRGIDAGTEPPELIRQFHQRFGLTFTEDVLADFREQMAGLGLLREPDVEQVIDLDTPVVEAATPWTPAVLPAQEPPPPPPPPAVEEPSAARPVREYMKLKLFNPDGLFTLLGRLGSPFSFLVWLIPPVVLLAAAIIFFNHEAFAHDLRLMRERFGIDSFLVNLVLATLTSRLLSKLAQGAVCRHFGGVIERLGIRMMFGVMPRLFIDKHPIRDLDRRGRLWSYAAPLLAKLSLFAGGSFTWFLARGGGSFMADFSIFLATIGLAGFLFTVNPLWKADGYNWLSTWLESPRLRERSFLALKLSLLRRPFPPQLQAGEKYSLIIFGLSTIAFTVLLLGAVIVLLAQALEKQMGGLGVVIFIVLAISFTGWFVTQIRWKRYRAAQRAMGRQQPSTQMVPSRGPVRPATATVVSRPYTKRRRFFTWPKAIILVVLVVVCLLPYTYEPGGNLIIYPRERFELFARATGEVVDVRVREGEQVEAGQVLALLDDLELQRNISLATTEINKKEAELDLLREGSKEEAVELARKQYEQAKMAMEFSKKEVERLEPLFSQGIISTQMYEDALAAAAEDTGEFNVSRANLALVASGPRENEVKVLLSEIEHNERQLDFYNQELLKKRIIAPAAGQIITAKVHEQRGKVLQEGALFAVLEDGSSVRVEILVPETDIGSMKNGAEVEFKMLAYPDRPFRGQVSFISPGTEAMPDNPFVKAVRVISEVPNPEGLLKSDMTGYAKIRGEQEIVLVAFTKMLVRFALVEMWSWLP